MTKGSQDMNEKHRQTETPTSDPIRQLEDRLAARIQKCDALADYKEKESRLLPYLPEVAHIDLSSKQVWVPAPEVGTAND